MDAFYGTAVGHRAAVIAIIVSIVAIGLNSVV